VSESGCSYVVEGSVRRSGTVSRHCPVDRCSQAGIHLWAERYDRDLEGPIFALQEEITIKVFDGCEQADRGPKTCNGLRSMPKIYRGRQVSIAI